MKKMLPIVLISVFLFTSCIGDLFKSDSDRIDSLPRELTAAEMEVIEADNAFGIDLLRNLSREGEQNVLISPLSISMALGMTVNGAAGETRAGMKEALRKSGLSMEQINRSYRGLLDILPDLDPAVEMKIANAIWYRQGRVTLRDSFVTDTRSYFDAEVEGLDFSDPAAVDRINGWVSDRTGGLIPEIIEPPIPGNIVTYLMNAVYFKGEWLEPFNPDRTRSDIFTTSSGEGVEVEMMSMVRKKIPTYYSEKVEMADLAYGDGLFSMTLLMPADPRRALDTFVEEDLTAENLDRWIEGLGGEGKLKMPKFELEYETGLDEILSSMGMAEAFSVSADFTNMYENENASIDTVQHKTFIRVDEEGTEAAAVTNVAIALSGPVAFDRPFIYLIRERLSGTIIFMGRMDDPTAE